MDRKAAQERVDRIAAFRAELSALEAAGAIELPDEQRESLRNYHDSLMAGFQRDFDVDTTAGAEKLSLAMRIASALGGLAFCLALDLFVEQFWGRLPLAAQIVLLVAAPLAGIALAEFASRRERTLYFTSLLCLIALAAFMVDLTKLAELLALRPTPGAIFAWAAMALLFAYHYRLRLQLLIGLVLAATFVPLCILYVAGFRWESAFVRPELLLIPGAAMAWLTTRQAADFAPVWRAVATAAVLGSLISLAVWGYGTLLPIGKASAEGIYTLLSFASCGGAIAAAIRFHWTETTILGSVFFVIFLLSKTYQWLWDVVPAYFFFTIIGLISLGLIAAFRRLREANRVRPA